MSEREQPSLATILEHVARDLKRQQRWNGFLLTVAIVAVLGAARWASQGPYASNHIHLALILAVVAMRGAEMELVRSVSKLASALATREKESGPVPVAPHDR